MGGRGSSQPARRAHSGFGFRRNGWGWGYGLGLGWAYLPFPDDFERGEEYARPDSEPPPPPSAQPVAFEPSQPEKSIQPILIEQQAGAWVQVSSYKQGTVSGGEPPEKPERAPLPQPVATPPRQIPPAVLVFRDGHQEEIRSYTIIGSTLYTKSDYWVTGSWTRKVEFADLNVPATLKANQEHGTPFRLPSDANEVIIRP